MRDDQAEPAPGAPDPTPFEGESLEESEILTCCALRFDGWAYSEATGLDFPEATKRVVQDGAWPESREERLAVFFALQRHLFKWGGEYEPTNGKFWRVF